MLRQKQKPRMVILEDLLAVFVPLASTQVSFYQVSLTGNSRRSPLTGSCHAVATSNIASKILEVKGILKPDEIIHPSFWSFHWTDMKGSTIEAMVNHESKQIEDIVAGVKSGRISEDPMKLKKHIRDH